MTYENLDTEGGGSTTTPTPREEGQYFEDGVRLIDFVLVYKEEHSGSDNMNKLEYYINELRTDPKYPLETEMANLETNQGYGSLDAVS